MICFLRKFIAVQNKFGRDESKLDAATLLILASVCDKVTDSKFKPQPKSKPLKGPHSEFKTTPTQEYVLLIFTFCSNLI